MPSFSMWLTSHPMTNKEVADAIGITEEGARLLRAGRRRPDKQSMKNITKLTKGEVTEDDFRKVYNSYKQYVEQMRL